MSLLWSSVEAARLPSVALFTISVARVTIGGWQQAWGIMPCKRGPKPHT